MTCEWELTIDKQNTNKNSETDPGTHEVQQFISVEERMDQTLNWVETVVSIHLK